MVLVVEATWRAHSYNVERAVARARIMSKSRLAIPVMISMEDFEKAVNQKSKGTSGSLG
ncbi:hypothetical protein [Methylacidiphilum caldifontis]|uniref:hypothetical protein n=1 Tax=Methylacidiphilum caldifontis TaxID=2795386 RepID=UPI00141BAB89|nr:hypothetical protein [Methylacidiphilum caldifontis]